MVSNFKKNNNNDNTRNDLTKGTNNYKYLSRCHYYGTLKDIEYISDAMVLVFKCYIATEYYGGNTNIRVYVPTEPIIYLANLVTSQLLQNKFKNTTNAPFYRKLSIIYGIIVLKVYAAN